MQVIDTPEGIRRAQYFIIRAAIKMYLTTGIRANSAYTPANMRAMVTKVTGKQYKRSKLGLQEALNDLTDWLIYDNHN
jgi:hypothetical protein